MADLFQIGDQDYIDPDAVTSVTWSHDLNFPVVYTGSVVTVAHLFPSTSKLVAEINKRRSFRR